MSIAFFFLAVAFLLAASVSFVAIIKPFSRFFPNRKVAALVHLGSWAGMLVSTITGAVLDPKFQQTMAVQQKADAQKAALAKTAELETAKQLASANAEKLQNEIKDLWTQTLAVVSPCDAASKIVANTFSRSSSPYELYPVVSAAKQTCYSVSSSLGELKPPASASGPSKEAFEKAISDCSDAYGTRAYSLSLMMDVVNGENRPSDVQEAVDAMQVGNQAPLRCIAVFIDAVGKTGISGKDALKLIATK